MSATMMLRPQATARRPFAALVVSPDPHRRALLAAMADQVGAYSIIPAASGAEPVRRARHDTAYDICVVDGSLDDLPVFAFVSHMRQLGWERVTLVTPRNDARGAQAALEHGIHSYVVASPTAVVSPEESEISELTEREIEVLQAVAEGMSNRAIGSYLGLSALTVKSHMARIGRKLGTGDRARMVALAMRSGVID